MRSLKDNPRVPRDTPSVSSHRSMKDGLTILRPDCASCTFLLLRSGARHPYGPASFTHCGPCIRSAHAVYLGCLQHPHQRKEMSQMMTNDEQSGDSLRTEEVATLGGSCFWCLEAVFDELRGVKEVVSGYSGGTVPVLPTSRSAPAPPATRRSSGLPSTPQRSRLGKSWRCTSPSMTPPP